MQSRIHRARFAVRLAALFNLDAATAARFANFVSDTPEISGGELIIRDWGGNVIARLPSTPIFGNVFSSPPAPESSPLDSTAGAGGDP